MKKIFVLTGEPSGDKLASKVIKDILQMPIQLIHVNCGIFALFVFIDYFCYIYNMTRLH